MAIHPFQIGDLNGNFLVNAPASRNGGALASEFAIVPDNVNGNTSRYLKLQAVWSSNTITNGPNSIVSDSFGQPTGANDNTTGGAQPWRPNGSYYTRGLWFTNTAVQPNVSGFRDGYVGSFISGIIQLDYGHDSNGVPPTVDYEPIYSHGAATWPMTADIAHQWLDSSSNPSDGTDQIVNSGSALTRTAYMPPAYPIIHIASSGSNTLGSGNVKFHVEQRPSLRMAGFNDGNGSGSQVSNWAGACTPANVGLPGPYCSDPLRNGSGLNTAATDNYHEFWQVTGTRPLNSRGLSFHLAKVFDNGFNSYAYPYEEDGLTPGTGITFSGASINPSYSAQVNNQLEYVWAGGRDQGASITSITLTTNVVTVTCVNTFAPGQVVVIQGLTNATFLNSALLTISTASGTQFTAAFTHSNYGPTGESQGTATANSDFRVHQAATFNINEEYYGMVMDTKCTIWSNKSSMIPLLFIDLAGTWSGSTAKRIAGVAVVPIYINTTQTLSWQVFFISEDGKLARYDFTQTNGVLELAGSGSFAFASSAPAVIAAGEAYGAIRARSTTSTITATSVTTNVATITAVNTFEAGEVVNITGLGVSTYLNNQTYTVLSSGLSGTQFRVNVTHGDYGTTGESTGTAVGYSLWVLYGTMASDPRLSQTGITNTANIGLYRYLIGTGVWGSLHASPNTGRHNARSLNEMIVARDTKLYMQVEDVTVTGGGPFAVSNAFGGVTNINWQVMAYDPVAGTWNTAKVNNSPTFLQYGTNMGTPANSSPQAATDFWFYDINAFLIDIAPNKIMIQSNWTLGALWMLDVSGSTAALSNSNLASVSAATLVSGNGGLDPFSIVHARDFATNGERTVFFQHDQVRSASSTVSLFLAPPSYNWGSPTALAQIQRNSYSSTPPFINSFDKDKWSYSDLNPASGSFSDHGAFLYPTQMTDNYIHFVRPSGGGLDGLPTNSTYGRSVGQTMGFLPTYWKWNGSAWVMADNWTDAFSTPRTVSAANVDVTLPYGLKVQFGPLSGTSYTLGEFHNFNMCYGNTKFARKFRTSWAQFAGQTFTNTETHTIASQNALSINLIDTDLGTVTSTAPTSSTPHTATVTTPNLGFNTQFTWPKIDVANAPFDATAFQMVYTPSQFSVGSNAYAPGVNVTGSNPYTWTVGANTYVATAVGDQGGHLAWHAFSGNPQLYWQSNSGSLPQQLEIDLGLGNSKTVLTYGFRPTFGTIGSETLDGGNLKSWTLEGSTDNASWTTVDTRSNIVPTKRSLAFTCNGTTGSYRYYRLNISLTQSGAAPIVGMLTLSTAALQTTINFSDFVFYAFGSQGSAAYLYPYVRNWQMCRGLKFEVSTNGGGVYSVITPLWRALNGYVYSFARQTGITNIRITVQHGCNYNTSSDSGNVPATTSFGPFYLFDYGVSQATLNAARLGSSGASDGTPTRGSFDTNCLGIAVDVPNISIDGGNPGLQTVTTNGQFSNGAVHGFWDFNSVPTSQYKLHPFYGFVMFQDAGANGSFSSQTGTNMAISYQWGRRV